MHTSMKVAALLVGAWLLDGCGDANEAQIKQAKSKLEHWERQAPRSYVYVFERHCFCFGVEPVRITVRDGAVVEAIGIETGLPKPNAGTMTDLLQEVVELAETNPARFDVQYDSSLGYLRSLNYDGETNTADDETNLDVSCLSGDLDDCAKPTLLEAGQCQGTPTEVDESDMFGPCVDHERPIGRIVDTTLVCCPRGSNPQ